MAKRKRDFEATHEPQLKFYVQDTPKVDPFATMFAASRAQAKSKVPGDGLQGATSRDIVRCYHCLAFEAGPDKMRQCSRCHELFCSLCSIPDYECHDVRHFCLDCKGL